MDDAVCGLGGLQLPPGFRWNLKMYLIGLHTACMVTRSVCVFFFFYLASGERNPPGMFQAPTEQDETQRS